MAESQGPSDDLARRRAAFFVGALVLVAIAVWLAPGRGSRTEPAPIADDAGGSRRNAAVVAPRPSNGDVDAEGSKPRPPTAAAAAATPDERKQDGGAPQLLAEIDPDALGRGAAASYRERSQYPPWSHPLQDDEDPILRDRQVSPITAGGPNGEAPLLTVLPDRVSFESPEPAILYAYLSEGDRRVPAQEISGILMSEEMQPLGTVEFRDDGGGADAVPDDHLYAAFVEIGEDLRPALSETFLVRVIAVTEEGLERVAATGFLYSNPAARLTGRFRDALVDGNLVIEAEIEALAEGRFHLEGTLYDGAGARPLVWAQDAVELGAGRHWMRLIFFGRALAQSGVDGPYLLRFAALSTTSQMPNAKNSLVEDGHRTAAYLASSFADAPFDDRDLLDAAERIEQDLAGGLPAAP